MNINYNHIKDEYKSLIDRDDSSYDIEDGIQEEKQSFETTTPSNKKISKKKTKTPVLDNFGKDLLGLKFLKEKESYWIKRKKKLGSMRKQF